MFAAVAMISAVSCNQELMDGPVVADKAAKTLTAMFDGAETKALLSEGTKTSWEYLDTILVYNGYYTSRYVTHVKDSSYVAEFEVAEQDEALAGDKFIAVYPLWADGYMTSYADIDRLTIDEVYLEKNQKARAGSYDPRTAISMAYTEDTTLVFKNATALLKFQVLNEGVKSVTVWTHNGEPIAGSWSLDYNDGEPVATPFESNDENDVRTANWVELHAGDKTFEVGKDYYISVFPQVAESGFTVEFCFEGSSKKLAAKSTDNSVEFQRNVILNLGAIEFTGEVPVVTGWGIAGELNAWGETADDIALKQYEDGLFVAYEVEFPDGEFKIRKNNDWSEGNYGMKYESVMEANHAYDVCAEGANMYVSAGIYDIWLDENAQRVYVMEPGVSIDEAVEPSAPVETWYLVGDFNDWTLADEAFVMDFNGEEHVYYNLVLDAPSGLKLNAGSWDVERGGASDYFATYEDMYLYAGGGNINVPAGSYDVYVNAEASTIRFEGESYEVEVPEYTWYLVGTFNDWTVGDPDYEMTLVDGWHVYEGLTFDVAGELKFNAGDWSVNRGSATFTSDVFALDTDINVCHDGANIAVPAGTYTVYLSADASVVRFEGEVGGGSGSDEPAAPAESWYLVGEFNGWTVADAAYLMEWDGEYLVYKGLTFDVDQKLKFNAGSWSNNRGGKFAADVAVKVNQDGADIVVPAGTYDVYLSADTFTAYFMTDGQTPDSTDQPEPAGFEWYLVGDFNGWNTGDAEYGMTDEGDYYVYYSFESTGNELKFNAGDWSNNRGGSFAADSAVSLSSGGANIKVPAGVYDIYLNKKTDTAWFMTEGNRP